MTEKTKKNQTKTETTAKKKTAVKASTKVKAKIKAKSTQKAVKATKAKKTTRTKISKRKSNLSKLCTEMNKMTFDAVDREIIKRFKIIIDTSEEDIAKTSMLSIIQEPKSVDLHSYHESLQPYIKHYLFMLKREQNKK